MLRSRNDILLGLLLALTSCSFAGSGSKHILVIAVDDLAVGDVNCAHELKPAQKSGFDLLCKDSVRFTHAFTPSVLAGPALTSLLTGLYPFEHGVRNNGPDFLSTRTLSIAKVAAESGYRTALFSGGAPILRSSGLQQGFEIFDDTINPAGKKIFRSADEIMHAFQSWSKDEDGNQFAVLYLPDLLFTDKETVDELGEPRNRSRESQIENLDMNLYSLFSDMIKMHQWDRTTIFVAGLNGHHENADDAVNPQLDLHSARTQVSLYIKPARNPRDEGLAWSLDAPVSLVDVGQTLLEFFQPGTGTKKIKAGPLQKISLLQALEKPSAVQTPQRWILSESAWGVWKKITPLFYSLRKDHLLLIHDFRDHFFNTLIDKTEVAEIAPSDSSISGEKSEAQALRGQLGLNDVSSIASDSSGGGRLLNTPEAQAETLIEAGRWEQLKDLGKQFSRGDWIALSERNLPGGKKRAFVNPCLKLLDQEVISPEERKTCNDRRVLALVDELQSATGPAESGGKKDVIKKGLLRLWKNEQVFAQIEKTNLQLGDIWNLSERHEQEHLVFLLALNHPRAAKVRQLLVRE